MNKEKSGLIAIVALVLSIAALVMCYICCQQQKKVGAADSATVVAVLNENPELVYNSYNAYVAELEKQRLAALMSDDGFAPIANPDGKITLVEIFDYSCGYCHRIFPVLKEIAKNNPDVKILAKPVVFLSNVSAYGAKASFAAGEQGKYAEMYDALFSAEGQLDEGKIDEIAAGLGLNMDKYKADVASEAVNAKIQSVMEQAQAANIGGVPTLILDGRQFHAASVEDVQKAIDQAKGK